jgi:hypothetical protein
MQRTSERPHIGRTLRVAEENPDSLPKFDGSAVLEEVLAQPAAHSNEIHFALRARLPGTSSSGLGCGRATRPEPHRSSRGIPYS